MARAGLGWSLSALADAAAVNKRTIMRHEADEPVLSENVRKLVAAFEAEGVVFIERGVYVGGVVPPVGGS